MSTLKKNLEKKINLTINTWKQLKEGMKDREKAHEISVFITDLGLLAALLNKDYVSEQAVSFVEDMYGQIYMSFSKKFTEKTDEAKAVDNNKETGFIKYGESDETTDHIKGITGKMLEEYLASKDKLKEQIEFKNNKDVGVKLGFEESYIKEDVKEYLKDLVGDDVEITDKIVDEYISAQNKLEERREFKKKTKGQVVKRVPPAPAGVDEIVSAMGMGDDLAKEFSVKRAKPLFVDVKKEGPVTKMTHKTPGRFVEELDWVKDIFNGKHPSFKDIPYEEMNQVTIDALNDYLSKEEMPITTKQIIHDYITNLINNSKPIDTTSISKEEIDNVIKNCSYCLDTEQKIPEKRVAWLSTVDKLEKLIGKLTTEKLSLNRRLTMAKRALGLAMDKVYSMDTEEIIKGTVYTDEENLKKEFEKLFSHKKYY